MCYRTLDARHHHWTCTLKTWTCLTCLIWSSGRISWMISCCHLNNHVSCAPWPGGDIAHHPAWAAAAWCLSQQNCSIPIVYQWWDTGNCAIPERRWPSRCRRKVKVGIWSFSMIGCTLIADSMITMGHSVAYEPHASNFAARVPNPRPSSVRHASLVGCAMTSVE